MNDTDEVRYRILVVDRATDVDAVQLAALYAHLSTSASSITVDRLEEVLSAPGCKLVLAVDVNTSCLLGCGLVTRHKLLGKDKALIDEFVVLPHLRGQGLGDRLFKHMVQVASSLGCQSVELTSGRHRVAAHAVYRRNGFEQRETDVYRRSLSRSDDRLV
jgi:GNAT superfamily N-acetyltransferase